MSDADDTLPITVGPTQGVVVLLEIHEVGVGVPPFAKIDVFASWVGGEREAMARYDLERGADEKFLRTADDAAAARARWAAKLSRGEPVHLAHNRTLRLRHQKVSQ
jgi:hypothetical protein